VSSLFLLDFLTIQRTAHLVTTMVDGRRKYWVQLRRTVGIELSMSFDLSVLGLFMFHHQKCLPFHIRSKTFKSLIVFEERGQTDG
jgi:hypothetical protein